MGWWSTDESGVSFVGDGEMMWGDGPADIIDNAIDEIEKAFLEGLGRKPTQDELISGMTFSARVYE